MSSPVVIPSELEFRRDELVLRTGRSKEQYLQQSIEDGLADTEDYYTAAAIRERVHSGEEVVLSSSELRANLGLDD